MSIVVTAPYDMEREPAEAQDAFKVVVALFEGRFL